MEFQLDLQGLVTPDTSAATFKRSTSFAWRSCILLFRLFLLCFR